MTRPPSRPTIEIAAHAQGRRYGADGDGRLPVRNRADAIDQTSRRWHGD